MAHPVSLSSLIVGNTVGSFARDEGGSDAHQRGVLFTVDATWGRPEGDVPLSSRTIVDAKTIPPLLPALDG